MLKDLKHQNAYKDEDVLKWLEAQVQATKEPGATIPSWITNAFENAMEQKSQCGAAAVAETTDSEDNGDKDDGLFNSDLVYFKVESTIFTVYKEWLMVEESPFPAMFSLPSAMDPGAAREGSVRTNPIVLQETSAASFNAFLRALYSSRSKILTTCNDLVGALELSLRWNFEEISENAFTELNEHFRGGPPAMEIRVARKFSVRPWLRTGLIDLAMQVAFHKLSPASLTNDSENPLDMATVANILFVCLELEHEKRTSIDPETENDDYCTDCAYIGGNPPCRTCRTNKAREKIVDRIFGPEIQACPYGKFGEELEDTDSDVE